MNLLLNIHIQIYTHILSFTVRKLIISLSLFLCLFYSGLKIESEWKTNSTVASSAQCFKIRVFALDYFNQVMLILTRKASQHLTDGHFLDNYFFIFLFFYTYCHALRWISYICLVSTHNYTEDWLKENPKHAHSYVVGCLLSSYLSYGMVKYRNVIGQTDECPP